MYDDNMMIYKNNIMMIMSIIDYIIILCDVCIDSRIDK